MGIAAVRVILPFPLPQQQCFTALESQRNAKVGQGYWVRISKPPVFHGIGKPKQYTGGTGVFGANRTGIGVGAGAGATEGKEGLSS